MKKILLLICLIAFISSIAGISAADNSNQAIASDTDTLVSSVDTLAVSLSDDEVVGSAENGTFTDLQNMIDDADEGSTVTLEKNYVYDEDVDSGSISIGKAITIDGNGYTLDGNNQIGIMNVNAYVVLNNINFVNGHAYSGGAIYSNYDFSIVNSTFMYNSADDDGGVIYTYAVVDIINSTFMYNSGFYYGNVYGGTVNCINSTFMNNHARGCGGAIYASVGKVINSTFISNSVDWDEGGAIYYRYDIDVVNSSFIDNTPDNINGVKTFESYLTVDLSSNVLNIGENLTIDVYTNYGATGSVTIAVDGVEYTLDLVDYHAQLEVSGLGIGSYKITSIYSGNDVYKSSTVKSTVNVIGSEGFYVFANDIFDNEDLIIDVYVSGNASGNVEVIIDGKSYSIVLVDSHAQLIVSDLEIGGHVISAHYGAYYNSTYVNVYEYVGTFAELQELINNAEYGSTIKLEHDYVYDENVDSGYISINKEITIDGNGHTLDGNNQVGIMNINSDVILSNLKFINGYAYTGGAIYSYNSDLSIINSTFIGNSANYRGGAIYSRYTNLVVSDSAFINNTDDNGNYAIHSHVSNLNIEDCIFSGNNNVSYSKDSLYLYIYSDDEFDYLDDVSLYIETYRDDDVELSVFINGEFCGNISVYYGYNLVLNNLTPGEYMVSFVFEETERYYGCTDSTSFTVNKFVPEMDIDVDNIQLGEDLIVNVVMNCNVTDYAMVTVGNNNYTISLVNGKGKLSIPNLNAGTYEINVIYLGNDLYESVSISTSAIVLSPGEILVSADDIVINEDLIIKITVGGNATDKVYVNINNATYTVGIVNNKGEVSISNLEIGEYVILAYYYDGNSTVSSSCIVSVIDYTYTFSDLQEIINNARAGSTIELAHNYIYDDSKDSGSIYINEDITINGNGHTLDGNDQTRIFGIYSCNVILNNMTLQNGFSGGRGGAIDSDESKLILNDCIFKDNFASDSGGAIQCFDCEINMIRSTFINNHADSLEGGVLHIDRYADVLIINSTFINNYAAWGGGAIHSGYSGIIAINSTFINNHADEDGGALHSGHVEAINSTFINNTANEDGGAISASSVDVVNSSFEGNSLPQINPENTFKSYLSVVLSSNVINIGEELTVDVYTNYGATGSVTITVDGVEYTLNLVDYHAQLDVDDLEVGSHTITSTYSGNDIYKSSIVESTVNVIGSEGLYVFANDIEYPNDLIVDVYVGGNASGTVSILINGKEYSIVLVDNHAQVVVSDLEIGYYDIVASYMNMTNATSVNVYEHVGTFTDLQELIDNAEEGSVVELIYSYAYDEHIDSGSIHINKAITINGNGRTLDGNNQIGIMSVESEVVLNNINFVNGHDWTGGAIVASSDFSIVNSTFMYNSADDDGGVIYTGNVVDIINSTFMHNSGNYWGNVKAGTVNCVNSIFMNNYAREGGGAIYADSVNVINSTFISNSADDWSDGGAIHYGNAINVVNSSFIDNTPNHINSEKTFKSYLTVDLSSNVLNIGEELTVDVYTNYGATGSVTITIDGVEYTLNLVDYHAQLDVTGLGVGLHTITSEYSGNDVYKSNIVESSVNVIGTEGLFVFAKDIPDNEDLIIDVYVGGNATGTVTVTVNGKSYSTVLVDNSAQLIVPDLEIGNYTIMATYMNMTNSTTVSVYKHVGTFVELQALIDDADAGSTIYLEYDYRYDDKIDDGQITIDKAITIEGNGHTLDGSNKVRIIYVSGSDGVIFNNLTFINGNTYDGGAIHTDNEITVINCLFENNTAQYGAAIHSTHGKLTVENSFFINNRVDDWGGAIQAYGTEITVNNSYFMGNHADDDGGAIHGDATLVTVNNSIFADNDVYYSGGAISTKDSGRIVVDSSIFIDNSANDGGALYSSNGVTVSSSTFLDNSASYNGGAIYVRDSFVNVTDSIFTSNAAQENGAAIHSLVSAVEITNSNFTDNKNVSYEKYSISLYVDSYDEYTYLDAISINIGTYGDVDLSVFINGEFYGNISVYYDYDLVLNNLTPGEYTVSFVFEETERYYGRTASTSFTVNKFVPEMDIDVENIQLGEDLIVNVVMNCNVTDYAIVTVGNNNYTISLVNGKGKLVIPNLNAGTYEINVIYLGNDLYESVSSSASAIVLSPGEILVSADDIVINEDLIIKITVGANATDKVYVNINNATYTVDIENNKGEVSISNLEIGEYVILAYYYDGNSTVSSSCIVSVIDYTYTFSDLQEIINNARAGSTIELAHNYIYDDSKDSGSIYINKAITINGNGHTLNGTNQIRIMNVNANVVLNNINFVNGHAYGGGAISASSDFSIVNSTFMYNSADDDGGVIYTGNVVDIINSTFMHNSGNYWGNVFAGTVNCINSTFMNNYARGGGGAIYADSVNAINSTFISNSADWDEGGAIHYGNAINVVNSSFIDNTPKHINGENTFKSYLTVDLSSNVLNIGEELTIDVYTNYGATGSVTVTVDGVEYTLDLVDYHAQLDVTGLGVGYHTITSTYSGNDIYKASIVESTVNVIGSEGLYVFANDIEYPNDLIVDVYVGGNASGTVEVIIDGKSYSIVLVDNHAQLVVSDLEIGYYNIVASYMNMTNTTSVNVYEHVGTFAELQELINNAEEGSVLELYYDYVCDEMFDVGINVGKSITINGNGHTLDGKNKVRIFHIGGNDIVLYNINFINGYSYDGDGGAIDSFTDIDSPSGSITLVNTTFENNYAVGWNYGGGAICANALVTVINSTFIDNSVDWGYNGGAIYASSVNIVNSTFVSNSAYDGGAVYCINGEANIDNSTFENNIAYGAAGAVRLAYLSGNITNSIFIANGAGIDGGAINLLESDLVVSDSTFINNTDNNDDYAIHSHASDISVENCTFIGNNNVSYGKNSISLGVYSDEVFDYSDPVLIRIYTWIDKDFDLDVYINDGYYDTITVYYYYDLILNSLTPGTYTVSFVFEETERYYGAETSVSFTVKLAPTGDINLTNDTFFLFFDEEGILRNDLAPGSITFIGEFSNLVDKIIIDRPVILLSSNATLYDMAIVIVSDDVAVDGFKFVGDGINQAILVNKSDNVAIINNEFDVNGLADNDNVLIGIIESNNVLLEDNIIRLIVETNGTYKNYAVYAENSDGLTISNNIMGGRIPSRIVEWSSLNYLLPYSCFVYLFDCDNSVLSDNLIYAISNGELGEYDTIYAVDIIGANANVINNEIGVLNGPYGYGIDVMGSDFNISGNRIMVQNETYAFGIAVDGGSNGVINDNEILVEGDYAAGIYALNYDYENINIANNEIIAEGEIAYGMYLYSSSLVEGNTIIAGGNFTKGIVSFYGNIIINNNTILANGSNVGTPTVFDLMDIQSIGVIVLRNNAIVTNNNISTTGEFAVDSRGTGQVTDNYLVADVYTGDASVNYTAGRTTVYNNVPEMIRTVISAEDIVAYYGTEIRYVAVLTNQEGNPLANRTIKFLINGEFYNGVTDDKGTAALSINLDVGNYIISASFEGDEIYTNSSIVNNITIIDQRHTANITVIAPDIVYGEHLIVEVILPSDSTGDITLFVGDKMYVEPINEGIAMVSISNLDAGDYDIDVIFPGDVRYYPANATATATVKKKSTNIFIDTSNIIFGDDLIVDVLFDDNINCLVSLVIGDYFYMINVTNGFYQLNISGLNAGNYSIFASYDGDANHVGSQAMSSVIVAKKQTAIDVSVDDIVYGEDLIFDITVDSLATGVIDVIVGEDSYSVDIIDGKARLTVSDLGAGNYSAELIYTGDLDFIGTKTYVNFIVVKKATSINASCEDIVYGDDLIANIYLSEAVNEIVTVSFNGKNYTVDLIDGVGQLSISDVAAGKYVMSVSYPGDSNLLDSNTVLNAVVNKLTSVLDVICEDVTYGEDLLVGVILDNGSYIAYRATGDVSFIINGIAYVTQIANATAGAVFSGLYPGVYTVQVVYSGDENFTQLNASVDVTVNKFVSEISINSSDITYGDSLAVDVYSNPLTGSVVVVIDSETYVLNLTDGHARLIVDNLDAGDYTIVATYLENELYYSSNATCEVTVNKKNTNIAITTSDIIFGEDLAVGIALSDNISDTVSLIIGNDEYVVEVINGIGQLNISTLNAGNYSIVASYDGDANYAGSQAMSNVIVAKKQTAIDVSVDDIVYGEDLIFDITVDSLATGVIDVTVGEGNYSVDIIGGKARLTVGDLGAGNYSATLTYDGDMNFIGTMVSVNFAVVKKATSIDVFCDEIIYGEDLIADIYLSEAVNESITVNFNGKNYTVDLIDGVGQLTISDLAAGNYAIDVNYAGNANLTASNAELNAVVNKFTSVLDIICEDVTYGEDLIVGVILGNGSSIAYRATGDVSFIINGIVYTTQIANAAASAVFSGLYPGVYTVQVGYSGNENFTQLNASVDVTVKKFVSEISVNSSDITYGDILTVDVYSNVLTGNVEVIIGSKSYIINLTDGYAQLTADNIGAGNYTIVATYLENDFYYSSNATCEVTVNKKDSTIAVSSSDIVYGEDVVLNIDLIEGATGKLLISYGDVNKTIAVTNIARLSGLDAGTYNIVVNYLGDNNFNPSQAACNVTVAKKAAPMTVTYEDIVYGDSLNVTVAIDVTGNVTIYIGNRTLNLKVVDGKVKFAVDGLDAGNYSLRVNYAGDNNYFANNTVNRVHVDQRETIINVNAANITYQDNFNLTMNINATGKVNVTIDNVTYTVEVVNNYAVVPVPVLNAGNYTVIVNYLGDRNYYSSDTVTYIYIDKKKTIINVEAENIVYGDDINVTYNIEATGNVSITMNNVTYVVRIINNQAVLPVGVLNAGNYTVVINYYGDVNYYSNRNETYIYIDKSQTTINVKADTIVFGDKKNVEININATGNVNVTINDMVYEYEIINNQVSVPVGMLNAGNYSVIIDYYGDINHYDNSTIYNLFIDKRNTTINVNCDDIVFGDELNLTVNVNATGDVNVTIDNVTYSSRIVNNQTSFHIGTLNAGNYTVHIEYLGDTNYYANDTIYSVFVDKRNTVINVNCDDIIFGDRLNITVNVEAVGDVAVDIANVTYYATVENNKASLAIDNINAGNYTARITYLGDRNYYSNVTYYNVFVDKRNTTIDVNCDDIVFGQTLNITANIKAEGKVNISIDNVIYQADIVNNTVELFVGNITAGNHTLVLNYYESANYYSSNITSSVYVAKIPADIVLSADDIIYGDDLIVNVNADSRATGTVNITVNGKDYTIELVNGRGNQSISGLGAGNYTISAEYSGDDNFLAANVSITAVVNKKNTSLNVSAADIVYGDNLIVIIALSEAINEEAIIDVDGQKYSVNLVDGAGSKAIPGLTAGSYNITVSYAGNDNLTACESTIGIMVDVFSTTIDATADAIIYGNDLIVNVVIGDSDVVSDATGIVTVTVGADTYQANINNTYATIIISGLAAGNYTAFVEYSGDNNFASANTTCDVIVNKKSTALNVTGTDISYGEDLIIDVCLSEAVNGTSSVVIDNVTYTVDLVNGVGSLSVSGLNAGEYLISATFPGNENFTSADASYGIVVNKISTDVIVSADDIIYGNDLTVNVNVDSRATGSVTINVNGKDYDIELVNGSGGLSISGLGADTYTISAEYPGDGNFLAANVTTTAVVNKKNTNLNVSAEDIIYGDDLVVDITLSEAINDEVVVNINGTNYTVNLVAGKGNATISNLVVGKYAIDVNYAGNVNLTSSSAGASVEVGMFPTTIDASANFIVYGDDLIVNVEIGDSDVVSDATGIVYVTVGADTYQANINNSIATIIISGLAAGNYTAFVEYSGDSNFASANTTCDVIVNKKSTALKVTGSDVIYGEDLIIDVFLSEAINESVSVSFNGKNYNVDLIDGVGQLSISDLAAGNYAIDVNYAGNANLTASTATASATVNKKSTALNVTGSDISYGEDLIIDVCLSEAVNGTSSVVIDGATYTIDLVNGVGSLSVSGLNAGEYLISAAYPGNENFTSADASYGVVVNKINTDIIVSADDIIYGNDLTVSVNVDSRATGSVTINVNGKDYGIELVNGSGSISISGLGADTYTISAEYPGDGNFLAANITTTAVVNKKNTNLNVSAEDIIYGDDLVVDITLNEAVNGTSSVVIGGATYAVDLVNGVGSLSVSGLNAGEYLISAVFSGNENFNSSSSDYTAVVNKANASIAVSAEDILFGDVANIVIIINGDESGQLVVTISDNSSVITTKTIDISSSNITVPIEALNVGHYNVELSYDGDNNHLSSLTNDSFEVISKDAQIIIDAPTEATEGDNVTVTVTLPEDATGTVTVGNEIVPVVNGTASAVLTDIPAGNITVPITYSGDDRYNPIETNVTISVDEKPVPPKENLTISASADPITIGEDAVIVITGFEDATGIADVVVDGKTYSAPIVDGIATVTVSGLVENVTASITYAGDDKYNNASATVDIVVNPKPKENATISIDAPSEAIEGDNVTVTVTLPEDATGTVTVGNEIVPVVNGTASVVLTDIPVGNITVPITYSGDDKYNPIETEVTISVKEDKSDIISAPDVTKYFHGPERFVVSVTDYEGNPLASKSVTIIINGVSYSRTTNAEGTCSMALNLPAGVYNITTAMDDQTVSSVVTILTTVNGTDIVKVFRNATQYYATFRDTNGNYLPVGSEIQFNINGVFYSRKVSENGLAKLNINLQQGEYVITAYNSVTDEMSSNSIVVLPRIIENRDLTKYFRNASQYTVKIIGDDGNPVGAGVEVTFNINGVIYTRTTNASGIAKMNINLVPGDYVITAEYNGCKVSNNIVVLPILSANDVSMKYRDGSKFIATLVDGQGRAYAGQTVQFNINGVLYNRVTNASGQAKLNINLMAGEYIITSSFNGCSISNKITISS